MEVSLNFRRPPAGESLERWYLKMAFSESYLSFVTKAQLTEQQECRVRLALAQFQLDLMKARPVLHDPDADAGPVVEMLEKRLKAMYGMVLTAEQLEVLNRAEHRAIRVVPVLITEPLILVERW